MSSRRRSEGSQGRTRTSPLAGGESCPRLQHFSHGRYLSPLACSGSSGHFGCLVPNGWSSLEFLRPLWWRLVILAIDLDHADQNSDHQRNEEYKNSAKHACKYTKLLLPPLPRLRYRSKLPWAIAICRHPACHRLQVCTRSPLSRRCVSDMRHRWCWCLLRRAIVVALRLWGLRTVLLRLLRAEEGMLRSVW